MEKVTAGWLIPLIAGFFIVMVPRNIPLSFLLMGIIAVIVVLSITAGYFVEMKGYLDTPRPYDSMILNIASLFGGIGLTVFFLLIGGNYL